MKIKNQFYQIFLSIYILVSLVATSCNQNKNTNSVTIDKKDRPIQNPSEVTVSPFEVSMLEQGLVNLKDQDASLIVDLKYSTKDNFFGEDVYGSFSNALLQVDAAKALKIANENLKQINPDYTLIVYDAARPHSIQIVLWEKLDTIPPKKRKDFVADPAEGSIHNYGCAVDLSIFNTKTNRALDMGTKYDFFGDLAYPRLEDKMLKLGRLTQSQIDNRKLLRTVMAKGSYEPINSEWWHFNFCSREKAKQRYQIIK